MICQTPSLASADLELTPDEFIMADLHFLLDDVNSLQDFQHSHLGMSQIKYVVDPIFYHFSGYNNIQNFYMDKNYLDIKVLSISV